MSARKKSSGKLKVADLTFAALFAPRVEEGRLFFNQRRAVIFDVEALGALRRQLVDTLGEELARGVLARFGYAHGYGDAKRLGENFSWESETDWLLAGPALHMLQGIVEAAPEKVEFDRSAGHFQMSGIWRRSYEAEVHLKFCGPSAHPVCWTLTGYAAGYASSFFGSELLAVETECLGRGDHRCRWEIRPVGAWGAEAEPYLKPLKAVEVINELGQVQLCGARFHDMALSGADWIWETDAQGRYQYCSGQVASVLGYEADELEGRTLFDFMPPAEAVRVREIFQRRVAAREPLADLDCRFLARDGREVVLLISGVVVSGPVRVRGVAKDITGRVQAEAALKESRERFRNLVETTGDWVWEVDEHGVYTYVSPQVQKILGYEPTEVVGRKPFDFMPSPVAARLAAVFGEHTAARRPFSLLENVNLHKDGREVVLETSGVPFFDAAGQFRGYRGIDRDITERKRAEETIRYQTYHDLLTGLPNRAQLLLTLQGELAGAQHRADRQFAVIHLDLDRFKAINDSLGHAVGDRVIVAVVERLQSLLHTGDTLARIGSDEFVILLNEVKRVEDVALFARRVAAAMHRAYRIEDHELYVTASIGISLYPEDGESAEALLRKADIAVSHVKDRGRNNFQFFNPAIHVRTAERLLLESSLRRAIERQELELHYQPQVNIRTGEVMCFEALARWRHPDLGLLKPAEFIPMAEEIGFIAAIDEWVLRTACAQNKAWQEAGYRPLCVTVNLSSQQFQQPTLIELVSGIVREIGLAPHYLEIEITESTAMRDIDLTIPNIRGLSELGVKLSIDDFGTGYSSLNYLKRFLVHTLKIDQSFIREVTTDLDDQAIVKAVIAMGHNLQLKVIAEGVETREQETFLRETGCDEMQGFLCSRPLPAEAFSKFMVGRE